MVEIANISQKKHFDVLAYFKPILPGLLFYSLFINILSLVFPLIMLLVYDRVIPNQATDTLFFMLLGVAIALLLEFVLRLARAAISAWSDSQFEYHTGLKTFHKLMKAPISEFEQEGTAEHLERLNALHSLKDFYTGQASTAAFDLPFVLAFMLMIAYISGVLIFVPLVIVFVFVMSTLIITKLTRNILNKRKSIDEKRTNFVIEVLTGLHTVKSLALEAQMLRRYDDLQIDSTQNDFYISFIMAISNSLYGFISQGGVALMAGFGAIEVVRGDLTVGGLAACTLLIARSLQPISRAMTLWTKLQGVNLAQSKLEEIMHQEQESEDGLPPFPKVKGYVEFQQVTFRYNEDTPNVFNELSCRLDAGKIIAIMGDDRSGRRTLLSMIMGLVKPLSGNVKVGGYNIDQFSPELLRAQIAYLPQKGHLFAGTILENITMFRPQYNQEALKIAIELGLDEVFDQLADGYDTKIDDGLTFTLPYGIKQRITLARALMLPAPVVLFHDANVGIGSNASRLLLNKLVSLKGKSLVIIVTNQVSYFEVADQIYGLRDGMLELMRDNTQQQSALERGVSNESS